MRIIDRFDWVCPGCTAAQHQEVDEMLGPFIFVRCPDCGHEDAIARVEVTRIKA